MPGGMVMGMQKAYLLIGLSIWCQFDDVLLASFARVQSAPLTDVADDEYLSVNPKQGPKKPPCRQKPVLVDLGPKAADLLPCTGRDTEPASIRAWPVNHSLLYVLMSLQR
jgi:hypothetical protein